MNKFKGFKLGKGKADIRKIGAAVVATMLVVAMVIGLVPSNEAIAAEKVSDYGQKQNIQNRWATTRLQNIQEESGQTNQSMPMM